jgi:hypothetical protein
MSLLILGMCSLSPLIGLTLFFVVELVARA